MVSAYVFMQFGGGAAPVEIISYIREIKGVKQAHVLTGPDDIVAFIEAEDLVGIENIILEMRSVAVVTKSDTRLTWSI